MSGELGRRYIAVMHFGRLMREKLEMNVHKGGWSGCDPHWLIERLKEEVAELEEALESGTPREIMLEAADCGNFSMMIADVVSQRCKT